MSAEIHHLVLSTYEVEMIGEAGRNLSLLAALAGSLGGDSQKLEEQAKVLYAIENRLLRTLPMQLVTRPEAAVQSA